MPGLKSKRVHVIINPVSGQDRSVLWTINSVFHPAGVDWDVFVTKKSGDARRFAQQSAAMGVDCVAVYGGDGTLMEVASGLIGSGVPVAILRGGTANVVSIELGIPADLAEECALISGDHAIREVDMGQVNDSYFLLSTGVGFAASMIEGADRDLKQRFGSLAYLLSAVQALQQPLSAHYRLLLDGQAVEIDGIMCLIANCANLGRPGLKLVPQVDISDGLLDIVVIRKADIASIVSVVTGVITGSNTVKPLRHWQAREISLVVNPPQTAQTDGEILGKEPLHAHILPKAVRFVVPAK